MHAINFFLEFLKILSVSTLDLSYDILVACNCGGHFLLELMELPFVTGCFLLLGLNLANLEVEVVLHKLQLKEHVAQLVLVVILLHLALGSKPLAWVLAISGDYLALVLVFHVVHYLRVYEVRLSSE